MSPLIDLRGVTTDLLRPTDNPVLTRALQDLNDPTRSAVNGAGFDNKSYG